MLRCCSGTSWTCMSPSSNDSECLVQMTCDIGNLKGATGALPQLLPGHLCHHDCLLWIYYSLAALCSAHCPAVHAAAHSLIAPKPVPTPNTTSSTFGLSTWADTHPPPTKHPSELPTALVVTPSTSPTLPASLAAVASPRPPHRPPALPRAPPVCDSDLVTWCRAPPSTQSGPCPPSRPFPLPPPTPLLPPACERGSRPLSCTVPYAGLWCIATRESREGCSSELN
jgi:hypothetical protein